MKDSITRNGLTYVLYWQTALDGKTWCRVKVFGSYDRTWQYPYYFKTKKAARLHILANT